MTDRKKPGVAFWATVVVVVVLTGIASYPLSLGPAIWMRDRGIISEWGFDALCTPAVELLEMIPDPVGRELYDALDWYVAVWE